jgi:hypothetical protein
MARSYIDGRGKRPCVISSQSTGKVGISKLGARLVHAREPEVGPLLVDTDTFLIRGGIGVRRRCRKGTGQGD